MAYSGIASRRQFLQASVAAAVSGAARAQGKRRPNVLFLFTDDQRFNTIQALNNPHVKTPNMDRLVRSGTSFTHAFIMGGTTPAVCMPSRGMLMTGQSLFRVHDNMIQPDKAPPERKRPFAMFPEVFRQAGYDTFGTGKWHNGPALYARCFTHGENIMFGGMSDHLKVPVADFDPGGRYPEKARKIGAKFSSELFSDSAIRFLETRKADKPWLAYVSYTAPHDPRMAPEPYASMYKPAQIELPPNFLPQHPFDNGEMKIRDEMLAAFPRTPEVVREHIAAYYAMITHMDHHIGRVLDALDKSGQASNTLIVFAGDNGLAVGQHGLLGKQNLYDHSVRVPMVLSGAGIPAGGRSDALVYLHDAFPTLCDYAGLATPSSVESSSLMPLIGKPGGSVRDSVFFAYRNFQRGVRDRRYKLIVYNVNGRQTTQLFDLSNDPYETKDISGDRAQTARAGRMRAMLKDWMKKTGDPADIDKPNWGFAAQA